MGRHSEPRELEEEHETSPLLSPVLPPTRDESPTRHPNFVVVATVIIISIFLVEIGDYMMRAPLARILENIVCRKYYESTSSFIILPIPEEDCKIGSIQGELAMLKGWDITFSCIPGLFLAVPYGVLADKYGRKLVWGLCSTGIVLSTVWAIFIGWVSPAIDIRWYWAGNAFLLIGGGSAVLKSMLYAMISDVASEDQRVQVFFKVNASGLIATIIGIPLAWQLMKSDPFVPMVIALGFLSLGFALPLFLPETLQRSKISDPTLDPHHENDFPQDQASIRNISTRQRISNFFENAKETHFLLRSPMLLALTITFLLQSFNGYSLGFVHQLASQRFNWTLGDASFLIPIGSVTTFLILIIILPGVYHILTTRFHFTSMIKDLVVARASLIIIIMANLVIAWAPLPAFYIMGMMLESCGAGYNSAIRSLVTSLVHPDQVSRLYAIMAVGDTIGTILYGPVLSKTFGWGQDLGGHWTGMTFVFCALTYVIVGLPVWLVREPTPEMDVHG